MLLVCCSGQTSTLTTSTRYCICSHINTFLAQDILTLRRLHCITQQRPNNIVMYFNLIFYGNLTASIYAVTTQANGNAVNKYFFCFMLESFNFLSSLTDVSFKWSYCKPLIIRGLFFFQPPIVLLRKYEIRGSQICVSRDCATPPPQPLPLSAPMRQS